MSIQLLRVFDQVVNYNVGALESLWTILTVYCMTEWGFLWGDFALKTNKFYFVMLMTHWRRRRGDRGDIYWNLCVGKYSADILLCTRSY